MMHGPLQIVVIVMLCVSNAAALAGQSRAGDRSGLDPESAVLLASDVERRAASTGARVFIIARNGRDPDDLPQGVHYTHAGIAVYSLIPGPDNKPRPAYVVHNLYQRNDRPDRSKLVRDRVSEFALGIKEPRIGVAIPSVDLQAALLKVMNSSLPTTMHNPRYSVVANPFNSRYQNCTEYTLDLIQAAVYDTTSMAKIKAANQSYFRAQRIRIPGLSIAAMFLSEISLDDADGPVRTATYTTLVSYLREHGLLAQSFEVSAPGDGS